MDRRAFVVALAAALVPSRVVESSTINLPKPSGQVCHAGIRSYRLLQAYAAGEASAWCWAACISIVFAYYRHPVSQQRVVAEAYGNLANMPATGGIAIARRLNRHWLDDRGTPFRSRVRTAYDFEDRVMKADSRTIVQEMDRERPIVIATVSHPVVATAVEYVSTPLGLDLKAVTVFDPFPGVGIRSLNAAELVPMHRGGELRFAATLSIR
jgi:hypothetical protein